MGIRLRCAAPRLTSGSKCALPPLMRRSVGAPTPGSPDNRWCSCAMGSRPSSKPEMWIATTASWQTCAAKARMRPSIRSHRAWRGCTTDMPKKAIATCIRSKTRPNRSDWESGKTHLPHGDASAHPLWARLHQMRFLPNKRRNESPGMKISRNVLENPVAARPVFPADCRYPIAIHHLRSIHHEQSHFSDPLSA